MNAGVGKRFAYIRTKVARPSHVRVRESALEGRLGRVSFARIIVHLDQIREIQPAQHGDHTVLLRNGTKQPLSRSLCGQLGKFAGGGPGQ